MISELSSPFTWDELGIVQQIKFESNRENAISLHRRPSSVALFQVQRDNVYK